MSRRRFFEEEVNLALKEPGLTALQALLSAGLSPIEPFSNHWQDSALALAAKAANLPAVKLCCEHVSAVAWRQSGKLAEALRTVVRLSSQPMIEMAIAASGGRGQGSPDWFLAESCRFDKPELIEWLLEKGADPLGEGRALHESCYEAKDATRIQKLLAAVARIHGKIDPAVASACLRQVAASEDMPHAHAAQRQISLALLSAGADPLDTGEEGRSALRMACLTLNKGVLDAMLGSGLPMEEVMKAHQALRPESGGASPRWLQRQAWLEEQALDRQVPAPVQEKRPRL